MEFFIIKNVLENRGWKYLKGLFPKTVSDIYSWALSNREIIKNYEDDLDELTNKITYNDRQIYDYFDCVKININVSRIEKKYIASVNNETAFLNNIFEFSDRCFADICGFINAMNIRENFLKK